jgi:uncharacterized membrane-anchored protein YhcB (DUF1043 family)
MTELETLLLRELEQQHESERLVNGLSGQLERLQTALNDQQTESAALRRELAESDRRHAEALDALTQQFEALAERLSALGKRSNG